jgi:hypothetical protein
MGRMGRIRRKDQRSYIIEMLSRSQFICICAKCGADTAPNMGRAHQAKPTAPTISTISVKLKTVLLTVNANGHKFPQMDNPRPRRHA